MTFGSTFGRTFSPTFQPKSQAAASAAAFVPTDITGCKLWLDFSDADTMFTDAGTTKVSSDGDLIYRINDKSGNNRHANQSTSGFRPAYKTNILNGKSAGFAETTQKYLTYPSPLGTATDFTVFTVLKYSSLANYNGSFGDYWRGYNFHSSANGTCYAGSTATGRIVTSSGYVAINNNLSICLMKSGTSSGNIKLYKNNGTALINTGGTAGDPTATSNICLFAYGINNTDNMFGYIYEHIFYNTALSDTDRGTVETYLNNKWAIY